MNYDDSLAQTRLGRGLALSLLVLLVWAPLPLGSNRDWSASLLILLIGVLGLVWAVALFRHPSRSAALPAGLVMLGLLLLTQVWVAVQWLFGLSADPGRTFHYLMLGNAYALLFIMIVSLFHSRRRLTLLLAVLVASGTFQAFFGSLMVLSGVEWLLGMPKEFYRGVATGTYVNRNHLAGYLEMSLACGIGLLLALRDGKPFRWREVIELLLGPKARLRIALVIMVIGLVMTHSRGGNAAFFTGLVIVGSFFVLRTKEHRMRNSLILISIIAIDILVIGHYFGLERLKDRLTNTEVSVSHSESGELVFNVNDLRGKAFTNSIPMAKEKPFVGYGAGSFEVVFIGHTGPNFNLRFNHAHNDYLQFWIEYGVIGVLPLALFVLLAFYHSVRALMSRDPFKNGIGFGSAMGIIAILIHSGTDFNLQIPANAATFVALCAIAVLGGKYSRSGRA